MTIYRFYFLDRHDHIAHAKDVDCDSDADALDRARSLHHAHGLEVWDGRRLVGRATPALDEE